MGLFAGKRDAAVHTFCKLPRGTQVGVEVPSWLPFPVKNTSSASKVGQTWAEGEGQLSFV